MPRSYQVTPAVLGRRRATQALPVRPSSRRSSRESARRQPENQPDRSDVTVQTPRTMTVTAVLRGHVGRRFLSGPGGRSRGAGRGPVPAAQAPPELVDDLAHSPLTRAVLLG